MGFLDGLGKVLEVIGEAIGEEAQRQKKIMIQLQTDV